MNEIDLGGKICPISMSRENARVCIKERCLLYENTINECLLTICLRAYWKRV